MCGHGRPTPTGTPLTGVSNAILGLVVAVLVLNVGVLFWVL